MTKNQLTIGLLCDSFTICMESWLLHDVSENLLKDKILGYCRCYDHLNVIKWLSQNTYTMKRYKYNNTNTKIKVQIGMTS